MWSILKEVKKCRSEKKGYPWVGINMIEIGYDSLIIKISKHLLSIIH